MPTVDPLADLEAAVQVFSNALCDDADDVGRVTAAVTVWEEVSFAEDGTVQRTIQYAVTGAQGLAVSVGLLQVGLARVSRDVMGCSC